MDIYDADGNYLLDEVETRTLMELQGWKLGREVAEWCILGYRFQLVRDNESMYKPGREDQVRYPRKLRLYEHRSDPVCEGTWFPSLGGQWHNSIRSAYNRAKCAAACYHDSKVENEKNKRLKELRMVADSLRPRVVTFRKLKRVVDTK